MIPSTPVHTLPLSRVITEASAFTEITVIRPHLVSSPGTTPSGTYPISSRAVNRIPKITASTDLRPCSLQYTSSRCRISANSSSTRPQPMPKASPNQSIHGCPP